MKPRPVVTVRGVAYECETAPDSGVLLGDGRRWNGYRVRFRELGARRWSSVLLIDHDHRPTGLELECAIAAQRHGVTRLPADA